MRRSTIQERGAISLISAVASFLAEGEIPPEGEFPMELLYCQEKRIVSLRGCS